MNLVLRQAGPCHNFENLLTKHEVEELIQQMSHITTQKELNELQTKHKAHIAHWDELMSACRTSATDLKKASEVGPRKGGAGKAKAKPKGKAKSAGKKAAAMYKIFDLGEGEYIQQYSELPLPASHDVNTPFITQKDVMPDLLKSIVGGSAGADTGAAGKELAEFMELFRKSDLRFTTGKASSGLSQKVQEEIEGALKPMFEVHHEPLFLRKLQSTACFGVIGKHRSLQFESCGFGTLRFCTAGQRNLLP